MDKIIIGSKRIRLYFCTLTIGLGIAYIPYNKSFHLIIGPFDLEIFLTGEE